MSGERIFSEGELRKYDGDTGPMYVACNGIVYDVSDCPHWRTGLHENLHFPGQELSNEIVNAPHTLEVFHRPCVRRVGQLR